MTYTPRMFQQAYISKAGKVVNTLPERQFAEFVEENGYSFKQNESRPFTARDRQDRLQTFVFQLDFVEFADPNVFPAYKATGFLPSDAKVKTDFEVDGHGHKDSNDPWKDAAKNRAGVRVIHIPGYLCKKKMWRDLKAALAVARQRPEMTVYLDEYSR